MADNTIDFNDPSNIVEMYNDQFNCEEWFTSLHTLDKISCGQDIKEFRCHNFFCIFLK